MNVVYHDPAMCVTVTVPAIGISTGKPIVKEFVERDPYTGSTEVTPSDTEQVLATTGYRMVTDIVIHPIPSNYGRIEWNGSTLTVS